MRTRRGLVVSLTLLLAAACSAPAAPTSSQPPQPSPVPTPIQTPSVTPTPTTTITPGTGGSPSATLPQPTATASDALPPPTPSSSPAFALRVQSADGVVTVEAPDGAVPAGTEIKVTASGPEQAPAELTNAGVARGCYLLEPEGTTFAQPVKVTMTRPRNYYGDPDKLPYLVLASRTAAGAWEWLTDSVMWLTDAAINVSGWVNHFSCMYDWSDRTDLLIDPKAPRTDKVGNSFKRQISLLSKDQRVNEVSFKTSRFDNFSPDVISLGPETATSKTYLERVWTCLKAGPYHVALEATLEQFAADNPFWGDLGLHPIDHLLHVDLDGTCTDTQGIVENACIRVHHTALGSFVPYLEFLLWLYGGYDVDYVEVTLQGANDDAPGRLEPDGDHFSGDLGLHNAGPKQLQKVLLHTPDGQTIDVTEEVNDNLGPIVVEFPEENTVGDCD